MAYDPNNWAFIDPMVPYGYSPSAPRTAGPDYVASYAGTPPAPGFGGAGGSGGGRADPGMSAGTPQSTGDMFRDSYAMAREMNAPSAGSIAGTAIGALTGLGPIGGQLGAWAQQAYNTTMGAREGNAARAGIGSGVPSQMALGAFLDRPGIMADLLAYGRSDEDLGPNFVDVGLEQGGYDNQNNSQGWGLADRAQADMDRAGISNNSEGEGDSDGLYAEGGSIEESRGSRANPNPFLFLDEDTLRRIASGLSPRNRDASLELRARNGRGPRRYAMDAAHLAQIPDPNAGYMGSYPDRILRSDELYGPWRSNAQIDHLLRMMPVTPDDRDAAGWKRGGAIRKYAQGGPVGALRMGSINTPRTPRTPSPPRAPRPVMPRSSQVHLRQAPRKYMTG